MCWMGGDDEKGRSAMHEVTGPGLYFRRVGCFWESEGKKDTEQTIHMNIQQIIKYMNQLMTQISACTQTYSFLVNRDQCITQSITLEAFQEIKGMDSLCIAFSIW